ncbi:MAG: YbhB/YbcL family Raf kinase inhibitor-like protein [Thaumarchaeota archaeon]|nr:YbhB/YbcL family Raf kinase inhibitor-like protein [Candidatus Wolframiiraptor allenii]
MTGFILESPAFRDNGRIPEKYTCDGLDTSPPLRWRDQPPGTKSFAIIVEDPDAPGGIFTHWIVYNIPADVNQLDEGIEPAGELPGGIMQGLNDFGRIGYGGPCPPPGKPHRYVFRIYALDTMLELGPAASKNELLKLMKGHILAEATLTGIYSRLGG